jgi:hypothetical protein
MARKTDSLRANKIRLLSSASRLPNEMGLHPRPGKSDSLRDMPSKFMTLSNRFSCVTIV